MGRLYSQKIGEKDEIPEWAIHWEHFRVPSAWHSYIMARSVLGAQYSYFNLASNPRIKSRRVLAPHAIVSGRMFEI